MKTIVIDCAGCGAPLGGAIKLVAAGALVPCLYCGALLRIGAADTVPVVERNLPIELIDRAREAALRGGREAAIALCVDEAQIDRTSAAAAVDDMIKNVASRTVFSQSLNAFGWVLVAAGLGLVAFGVYLLAVPPVNFLGIVPLAFGGVNLFGLRNGVSTSLRAIVASRGVALIGHSVCVGPTGFSDGALIYSLAVDVTPANGDEPFHARLVVPVRPQSVHKVAVGQTLPVRYTNGGAWLRSAS